MGYFKKTICAGNTMIVEKGYDYFQGLRRFGGTRGPRLLPSPERIKQANERRAVIQLTALLNENFRPGDFHLVMTYREADRPSPEEARVRLTKFIRKLREIYRAEGCEMRYVHTTEYKNTAIHHHMVVNYMDLQKIQSVWEWGAVRPTVIYSDNLQKLAEYFVKETRKTFQEEDSPYRQRYVPSRNLRRPEMKKTEVEAESWLEEPRTPEGWYLDRDSLESGIREESGYPYQFYVLVKIRKKQADLREEKGHEGRKKGRDLCGEAGQTDAGDLWPL